MIILMLIQKTKSKEEEKEEEGKEGREREGQKTTKRKDNKSHDDSHSHFPTPGSQPNIRSSPPR